MKSVSSMRKSLGTDYIRDGRQIHFRLLYRAIIGYTLRYCYFPDGSFYKEKRKN